MLVIGCFEQSEELMSRNSMFVEINIQIYICLGLPNLALTNNIMIRLHSYKATIE